MRGSSTRPGHPEPAGPRATRGPCGRTTVMRRNAPFATVAALRASGRAESLVVETPARSVADSRATLARLTVPSDANVMGSVFGGVILDEVDRTAYITAARHCHRNCVTASF